jgi:ribosomal protein S12 methylthiotransferase
MMKSQTGVALISLGCPKNLVDSEKILGRIAERGGVVCQNPEDADVLIVNTCGFIESAKQESIDAILEASRLKTSSHQQRLIVTGCLAQRYKESLQTEIPEIDDVIGLGEFDTIAELIVSDKPTSQQTDKPIAEKHVLQDDNWKTRLRLTPRHYAYLRVSEGCNNPCTYCAIPAIRGPFRSRPVKHIIEEAEQLAIDGTRELNIVAEDTTAYGIDIYAEQRLHTVLHELSRIDEIHWIRLLYTHPAHFYPELIEEIARNEKVCKYIDLPIQHINDEVLEKMGRKVNRSQIEHLIKELRNRIPGLFIRTSVIVGFPGETERQFNELLHFIEDTAFERLGAFTYSKEEDTKAANMPRQSSKKTQERRLERVMSLQQSIAFKKNKQMIGKTLEVLIEERSKNGLEGWLGRTYGDAPDVDANVLVHGSNVKAGDFCRVLITDTKDYDLIGRC